MLKETRFGRKMRVPPTAIIKHELRMMAANDALIETLSADGRSPEEVGEIIGTLISKYHISRDQAYTLMDQLGIDRSFLKTS